MMQANDVLRRLRYALNLHDQQLAQMANRAGGAVTPQHVTRLLLPEDHPNAVECSPAELEHMLDGLIMARRGPPDPSRPPHPRAGKALTNNDILKKCRIALTLKDSDILHILAANGLTMGAPELNALFRNPSHKHYRECGDQLLRKFLMGLAKGPPRKD